MTETTIAPAVVRDLHGLSATEVIEEAKRFKSADALVQTKFGVRTTAEYFFPVIEAYVHNYLLHELQETVAGGTDAVEWRRKLTASMDLSQHVARYQMIGQLLGAIVPNTSAYACVTLSLAAGAGVGAGVSGSGDVDVAFNFAYVYVSLAGGRGAYKTAYISIGDSLPSPSGEWRGLTCDFHAYTLTLEKYAHVIDDLVGSMPFKQAPEMHVFYGSQLSDDIVTELRGYVEERRYLEHLMALAWFVAHQERAPSREFAAALRVGQRPKMPEVVAADLYRLMGSMGRTEKTLERIGQKLMYMTPDELDHQMNPEYQAWNEVATWAGAVDLVLNAICPCVAVASTWFFVHGVGKSAASLFNRKETRARIALSETVRLTPADARVDKILSDTAVCMVGEHVGPTFGQAAANVTTKHVFEIVYAALCLHSRMGKIHGDLHCDNVTLAATAADPTHHVMYIIGEDSYVFDGADRFGCIIDFSRVVDVGSVVWIERVIDKFKMYFKRPAQMGRADAAAFDARIYGAIDDATLMATVVRATSAFDLYEFALTLGKRPGVVPAVAALLCDIMADARTILLGILDLTQELPSEWPAATVIKKRWRPTPQADVAGTGGVGGVGGVGLTGMYCADNPMRYSARAYETLPRSLAKAPMIRDAQDAPVDSYFHYTLDIKSRYAITTAAITSRNTKA